MDLTSPRPDHGCPLCRFESIWVFDKVGYAIRECRACGHRFVSLPAECFQSHIAQTYADHYFQDDPGGVPNYLAQGPMFQRRGRAYGKMLRRFVQPGRLLDIGAAAGFLLAGFLEEGWQGEGIEPNATMARYGHEQLGLTIHACSLEAYTGKIAFDLVSAIQVVAHFVDPLAAFLRMRELLAPGGLLLIETWNVRSYSARWLGRHWHEYNPPSVLHYFSRTGLQAQLEQLGFDFVAAGRPWRWIRGHHMRTILQRMLVPLPWGNVWKQACRLIPNRIVLPYPPEDVFWILLRKR